MMIKKKIALIFIVLAGIGLIANAVLPHHHHGDLICFNLAHCHPDCNHSDPLENDSNHDHDCNSGCNDCIVKEYFTMPEAGVNLKSLNFTFIDHDFQKHHYTILFHSLSSPSDASSPVIFKYKTYRETYHSILISHSLISRGPPVILSGNYRQDAA